MITHPQVDSKTFNDLAEMFRSQGKKVANKLMAEDYKSFTVDGEQYIFAEDFSKVPTSIIKEAALDNMFGGKSPVAAVNKLVGSVKAKSTKPEFMGVVKNNKTGFVYHVYSEDGVLNLLNPGTDHSKYSDTTATSAELESDYTWTRFPSKNEAVDDEYGDAPDDNTSFKNYKWKDIPDQEADEEPEEDLDEAKVEDMKEVSMDDYTISVNGDYAVISSNDPKGRAVSAVGLMPYIAKHMRGFDSVTSMGGKDLTDHVNNSKFQAGKLKVTVEAGTDVKTFAEKVIADAINTINVDLRRRQKSKAAAPARAASAAKSSAAYNKAKNDEIGAKLGLSAKDMARVTSRQVGGDDGYQHAILIDGKVWVGGLTKSEVPGYKMDAYRKIAKQNGTLPESAENLDEMALDVPVTYKGVKLSLEQGIGGGRAIYRHGTDKVVYSDADNAKVMKKWAQIKAVREDLDEAIPYPVGLDSKEAITSYDELKSKQFKASQEQQAMMIANIKAGRDPFSKDYPPEEVDESSNGYIPNKIYTDEIEKYFSGKAAIKLNKLYKNGISGKSIEVWSDEGYPYSASFTHGEGGTGIYGAASGIIIKSLYKEGLEEGANVSYTVLVGDPETYEKKEIEISALDHTSAKEEAEAQGYKVFKVMDTYGETVLETVNEATQATNVPQWWIVGLDSEIIDGPYPNVAAARIDLKAHYDSIEYGAKLGTLSHTGKFVGAK